MDTFPVQDIPAQQVSAFPSRKINLKKFFNASSWIIFFALLPLTVLIFLSQNTIPGDLFYPVKRGMENVILTVASVSPATRAAFRTDLTATRFKEAQGLVLSKSNASGLTTFIDEVQTANAEIAGLKGDNERQKAEEKLLAKIEQYQSGLSILEAKTQQNLIALNSQENFLPTPTPRSAESGAVEVSGSLSVTISQSQTTRNFPSPSPTPIFTAVSALTKIKIPTPTPTFALLPSSAKSSPTSAPNPPAAIVPDEISNRIAVSEQRKIAKTIQETKHEIDEIKKSLEEDREGRNQEKEKTKKANENKRKDKENKEKENNPD